MNMNSHLRLFPYSTLAKRVWASSLVSLGINFPIYDDSQIIHLGFF